MHFDGAKSRHGVGAGIVLISPSGEEKYFSFRLEFEATNNMAEYEDLLLGLEIARDQKIKCLSVIGDSDLIMPQVKNQFAAKNNRLRDYRNVVWVPIEMFDAFAIQAVPREENTLADALSVIACTFEIPSHLKEKYCKVEVIFRSLVPNNQDRWQVFDSDAQIIAFLQHSDNFQNCNVELEDKVNNLSLQDVDVMKLAILLEKKFNRDDE